MLETSWFGLMSAVDIEKQNPFDNMHWESLQSNILNNI